MNNSEQTKFPRALVALMKNAVNRDTDSENWETLLTQQYKIDDYVSKMGLTLVFDEMDGYGYLKQRTYGEGEDEIPRIIPRHALSYPVSLLLLVLRKRLLEFDTSVGDQRLILSKQQIAEQMRVFLRDTTNEAKLMSEIERHIDKVEKMGFLRRLRSGGDSYEVQRILRSFINAEWMGTNMLSKLEEYRKYADRELSIKEDFSKFGGDMRTLKKRLKDIPQVSVFDEYIRYSQEFRRKLGISGEQALDLFQQTVSMKKVEALTEFVRTNMLEAPKMELEVDKLIKHFQDLDSAHAAIVKAKNQIEMLTPVTDSGKKYNKRIKEREQLAQVKEALMPWFAGQKVALLEAETASHAQKKEYTEASLKQAEGESEQIDKEIERVNKEIYANGGGAIESVKEDIMKIKTELSRTERNAAEYTSHAEKLDLKLPASIDDFMNNRQLLSAIKTEAEKEINRLENQRMDDGVKLAGLNDELSGIQNELKSLRSRKSNIPMEYINKREELIKELGLKAEDVPFVGELLEVREGDEAWEGAIERLLHGFGISLLVQEQHYTQVMRWVDKTRLGLRLVYYRVSNDRKPQGAGQANPFSVPEKLNIKQGTAFFRWLKAELTERFSHTCCENEDSFRRERNAVTKAGQIKTGGKRHEKDDRRGIFDRGRYVLGFSNQKKIQVLETSEGELKEKIQIYDEKIRTALQGSKKGQDVLNAAAGLERISEFVEIDIDSVAKSLSEKKSQLKKLEQSSNVLAELNRRLEALIKDREDKRTEIKRLNEEMGGLKNESERLEISMREALADMKAGERETPEACEAMNRGYIFLSEHRQKAIGDRKITLSNIEKSEKDYRDWIESKQLNSQREIEALGAKIVRHMGEYNNKFQETAKETDANIESLPFYADMLNRLMRDNLPKYEKKFKELLNENIINQIALFQAKLKEEQDVIKERIDRINHSLSDIDYNDGRYIRLEYEETYDSEIKDFRVKLKACTEGALAGSEDEQYAETKFLQVKSIIERFKGRPGETEADGRWTKKVIDVRNWFLFAASERWRETNEEYEHYTDSGGKSGGQKEKLAYTILAASLVYHFGLEGHSNGQSSFRFVVIDEAFLKSSDESARFGLELFKRLDLQLLIVTPLLKIPTIAQFISHVGFVHHDDINHKSMLRNISIDEYERERKTREAARNVTVI